MRDPLPPTASRVMENPIDHPLTLTVEQTAKLLGIGRSTAYELVRSGDIPSLRLGRRIVVPLCRIADKLGAPTDAVAAAVTSSAAAPLASLPTKLPPGPAIIEKASADRAPTLF